MKIIRKKVLLALLFASTALFTTQAFEASDSPSPLRQESDTLIVNTKDIAADIRGFKGDTPLNIYISEGIVVKVEALNNRETPRFFNRVSNILLDAWNGMTVSQAKKLQVDGVTGATYSSRAVIETVQRGLEYYDKTVKDGK